MQQIRLMLLVPHPEDGQWRGFDVDSEDLLHASIDHITHGDPTSAWKGNLIGTRCAISKEEAEELLGPASPQPHITTPVATPSDTTPSANGIVRPDDDVAQPAIS